MLFEKLYNKLNKPLFVENPITNIYKSYHVKKALYNPIDNPVYLIIYLFIFFLQNNSPLQNTIQTTCS